MDFHIVFHDKDNISPRNKSNRIKIEAPLRVLVEWCFSTRASVATVQSTFYAHPAVYEFNEFSQWEFVHIPSHAMHTSQRLPQWVHYQNTSHLAKSYWPNEWTLRGHGDFQQVAARGPLFCFCLYVVVFLVVVMVVVGVCVGVGGGGVCRGCKQSTTMVRFYIWFQCDKVFLQHYPHIYVFIF